MQIIAGFLGAGKTTFLNRYLPLLTGKTVVIENEFGDIGIDGGLIQGDQPVRELRSGCICCSLAADLMTELENLRKTYAPEQIVMEPSGIGNLSDIIKLCDKCDVKVTKRIVLVDVSAFLEYYDAMGSFFMDQVCNAGLLLLSHMGETGAEELQQVTDILRENNPRAVIYAEDWRELNDEELLALVQASPDRDSTAVIGKVVGAQFGKKFTSVALKELKTWQETTPEWMIKKLRSGEFGEIFRVKGYFPYVGGGQIFFDLTPADADWRILPAEEESDVPAAIVIGSGLQKQALRELFKPAKRVCAKRVK